MTPATGAEHWNRIEKLFYQALELDRSERAAFLEQTCGEDAEVRKEVESLLESSEQTLGFLKKPVEQAAQQLAAKDLEQQVGPYRLIGLLGEGGMGKVYLASRADEVYEQEVAVKLMHAGLRDAQAMLLRFHAERQILANLNHPNIARLLDGGITADGASYLVMEYVKGIPIDEYCRVNHLGIKDRLELFRVVCDAVEYAHKNLVVHRDIKPANILVTPEGVPKLLDFGIAKLLSPDSSEAVLTRTTERLMTPEYASPEQVRGDPVTTATDVYGLGVLLYELLAGRRPFRLETKSPLEVMQVICQQDPELPSAIKEARTESGSAPGKQLAGDLDNIVLMAMRKEPGRRYISVSALAADIQAYLQGYPVRARTDSWSYRSGKFVRRHRASVVAAGVVALALVAFSIGMALLARRANRERLTAQRESQFLASVFEAATPEEARGKQVTARQLLDAGAKRIDQELADQPLLQASMLDNLGRAYSALGVYEQAEKLFQRAYDIRRKIQGPNALDTAESQDGLAMSLRLEDKFKDAEPLFRQSLAVLRKSLGENDLRVAESMSNLGECLYWESQWNEAEPLLRQALAIKRRLHDEADTGTWNFLGLVLERKGEYPEAAELLNEVVDLCRRKEGTDGPNYLVALHNLAGVLIDAGDLSGAEKMERETLETKRRIMGNDHPELFYSLNNLGWILLQRGDWKSAGPFLRENIELVRKAFGDQSHKMVYALKNWGLFLQEKEDYADAEKIFKQALELAKQTTGDSSFSVEKILAGWGELEFDRGRYDAAEVYARQALELIRKLGENGTPDEASTLIDLGEARIFQSDAAGAEPMLRESLKIREEKFNGENPAIMVAEIRLGEDLTMEGKSSEAEPLLRRALRGLQSEPFPIERWQTAEAESALGACLLAEKQGEEGETLLRESERDLARDPRPAFRRPANARSSLIRGNSR